MEYGEDRAIEVAIKTLNQCPTKNDFKDFQREISVMKVRRYDSGPLVSNVLTTFPFVISAIRPPKHCQNHNINGYTSHSNHNGIRKARIFSQIFKFQ